MGYLRGALHGVVVGTVAGLCIAPQEGRRTREQLSGFINGAQRTARFARRAVEKVAPQVGGAAVAVKHQVDSHRSHDSNGHSAHSKHSTAARKESHPQS
jgi:gas vesicle protein